MIEITIFPGAKRPALARWLTSNPQHNNPGACLALICHANGPLALPWPLIADELKVRALAR
jgi:hypothetical protein